MEWEAGVIVVLEALIKVDAEQLEDETEVAAKDKVGVELYDVTRVFWAVCSMQHVENVDLDPCLIEVCGLVFYDLDGDDLGGALVGALDDLAKGAGSEKVEDGVVIAAVVEQGVVDVEDVVVMVIVVIVVVGWTVGEGETTTGF